MSKIIIADDNRVLTMGLQRFFIRKGYEVETAFDGRDLLEKCQGQQFDVALVDLRMPNVDGMTAIAEMRRLYPRTRIIIITGHLEWANLKQSVRLGVMGCLLKPFGLNDIEAAVATVLEKRPGAAREWTGEAVQEEATLRP